MIAAEIRRYCTVKASFEACHIIVGHIFVLSGRRAADRHEIILAIAHAKNSISI
jgi:hypothetical protein